MDLARYYASENEKPLDQIPADGGFAGIFRRIACIGDSLSSGEFEAVDSAGQRGYYDFLSFRGDSISAVWSARRSTIFRAAA